MNLKIATLVSPSISDTQKQTILGCKKDKNGKCIEEKKSNIQTMQLSARQCKEMIDILMTKNAAKYGKLEAFTNSSSFVGNVRYDSDEQSMRIILSGNNYNFCNVPRRKFDVLQGSTSIGKAFNDIIKGQHDC